MELSEKIKAMERRERDLKEQLQGSEREKEQIQLDS
jgi:hypothetical protein